MDIAAGDRAIRAPVIFALLGAPGAFTLQQLAAWYVEDRLCVSHAVGDGVARAMEFGIDVVAILIGVAAVVAGIRVWRTTGDPSLNRVRGQSRPDFLASCALFVSVSFLIGIGLMTFSSLLIPLCARVR